MDPDASVAPLVMARDRNGCVRHADWLDGRLDEHGRQVDANGKLVKAGPVLTLKANRLGSTANNPYLQFKSVGHQRGF